MRQPGRRARRRSAERGAAAVEFGLVVPLLLALLLGIVDYGLIFNDAISTRNGVREAARQGVVSNFGAGDTLADLQAQTKSEIGSLTGSTAVKVHVPGGDWERGEPLVICAIVSDPGLVNFVPTPDDVRSKVEMSIETQDLPPDGALSVQDAGDWSWC